MTSSSWRAWVRPGQIPLLPFAPLVVLGVGVAVAVVMALFGLVALRQASDEGAQREAEVLARVLAARVRVVAAEDRAAVVEALAHRTGAELALVDVQGEVVADTLVGPPARAMVALLVAGRGIEEVPTGRAAFAVQALEPPFTHLSLVVFVHAPGTPAGARSLGKAVAVLTAILVSVAAAVAFVFSKNARDDVEYVRARIEVLAREVGGTLGAQIPLRTFDQVGVVAASFNGLLERFAAAERSYRHDLQQAEALDQARARFLATLSHELRTPLNAILGFADVLLSEVDGPLTPSSREDLQAIRSSGEHLRALIDDILDLSAIETGSLRLERRTVDVLAIAEQVVREAQPLIAGRRVRLSLQGEAAEAWVDPRRVRQILANLVGNAIKFTAAGEVTVRVEREGEHVVLEVRDTGPGIAESEAAVLFQEYRQVGDVASRRKGTGLGLAIAKRLTSMHDGRIELRSRVGQGSTFRVELPARAPS